MVKVLLRAVSRILFSAEAGPIIYLLRSTRSSHVPKHALQRAAAYFLFDLAPSGVCHAIRLAAESGSLLHHLFTLTCPHPESHVTSTAARYRDASSHRGLQGKDRRYLLCGTFRPRCLNIASPGTCGVRIPEAPCPVESGLSSTNSTKKRTVSGDRDSQRQLQDTPCRNYVAT